MNEPPPFFGTPGESVPAVDPEDLQAAHEMLVDLKNQRPDSAQLAVGVEVFRHACKPGADIPAVSYRCTMLQILPMVAPEQFAGFIKEDENLDAAVYREFASFPMTWMGGGAPREGLPFDAEELLRRLSPEKG